MANLPIRGLGSVGFVPDVSPYDLPLNAYSRADNVLFEDGKLKRGFVLRTVYDFATDYVTTSSIVSKDNTGQDNFYVCNLSLDVRRYSNGVFTSQIDSNYSTITTPSGAGTATNSALLGDVVYFNKAGSKPIYKLTGENFFRELYPKAGAEAGVTSTWGSSGTTWTCNALRPFGDFMVALNMSEGAASYPARVRFSDPVTIGQPALNWDAADTTNSAGFTDLAQLEGGIVDGLSLNNQFIIYGKNEAWLMEFVGGQFIMNFRRLYADQGVININCVKEIDNNHYVFGADDIYRHNGTQKESICDGRVRDFIFDNMAAGMENRCFVHHSERFKKLFFCFQSTDPYAEWIHNSYCNRAAVYDYAANTWSFMDLPNVVSGSEANIRSFLTYDTIDQNVSYENIGGTYDDTKAADTRNEVFFNTYQRIETPSSTISYPVASSDVYYDRTHNSFLALDTALSSTSVVSPFEVKMNALPKVERTGIDLDETGLETRRYKNLSALYPQMSSATGSRLTISVGAADLPNNAPNYTTSYSFNPTTEYHLNTRASGRYLSYKLEASNVGDYFEISGIDAEFMTTGKR